MAFITVEESKSGHTLNFVLDLTRNINRVVEKEGEGNGGQGSCGELEPTEVNTFRKAIGPQVHYLQRLKVLARSGRNGSRKTRGLAAGVFKSLHFRV